MLLADPIKKTLQTSEGVNLGTMAPGLCTVDPLNNP